MASAKRHEGLTTLRVRADPNGRFEVCDGLLVLGTSQNELMAIWSAVGLAEQMGKSGRRSRVVRVIAGEEVEEWPGLLAAADVQ